MVPYDKGYEPPAWWLDRLTDALADLGWDNSDLAREARDIDGRGKAWGADRISKMRSERKGTFQLVAAVSEATNIPPPVVEAVSIDEADALRSWIYAYRRKSQHTADIEPRREAVAQALDAAVKDAADQMSDVASKSEGRNRGTRAGRPARSR